MSVSQMWLGALTPDSVRVCVRAKGAGEVGLLVSKRADLSDPDRPDPVRASDDGVAHLEAHGLEPDTVYHFGVEVDGEADAATGRCRTAPRAGEPADFTVAGAACAGLRPQYPGEGSVEADDRLSNHPVFDVIRNRDPLMFIHMGDLHYYDIGSNAHVDGHDAAVYRAAYNDVFAQSRQRRLYRTVPTVYLWDDHDYGPDDSDADSPGREAACQVYRERVPHYPLADGEGVWQSWTIGRVLFVGSDVRSARDPIDDPQSGDKTLLGSAQKEWLSHILQDSDAAFLVLVSPARWFDSSVKDSWDSYKDERSELIELFDSNGWASRMCIMSGDVHAAAIDTGGHSPGGIPLFHFGSLDSDPPQAQDHYDSGPSRPGRGQYGLLQVSDDGTTVTVTATAYKGTTELMSHTVTSRR